MTELEGFTLIQGMMLARVAGAHDLSPTVFYELGGENFILVHPNDRTDERLELNGDLLVKILRKVNSELAKNYQ